MIEHRQHARRFWTGIALMVTCALILWRVGVQAAALTTNGASGFWTDPDIISDTTELYGDYIPQLRTDSRDRLLLLFNHGVRVLDGLTIYNPYYVQSSDEGKTWTLPAPVRDQPEVSLQEVKLAFDSNDVAQAVWHSKTTIWHARESQWPGGANQVAAVVEPERVSSPDIAVGPEDVFHVIWRQGDGRLFHAFSDNGGVTWTTSGVLSDNALAPALAVDEGHGVHVAWEERRFGGEGPEFDIRVRSGTYSDGSMNWAPESELLFEQDPGQGIGEARTPAILADGDRLHLAFGRRDSDKEQYAYYVDYQEGQGWGTPVIVSGDEPLFMNTNVPYVLSPQLALCGGRVHIYYHGAFGTNQLERIIGLSGPGYWSGQTQVTFGDARAIRPSLACAGGQLKLTYEEILDPDKLHYVYFQSAFSGTYLPLVQQR